LIVIKTFFLRVLLIGILLLPLALTSAQDDDWDGQTRFTVLILGMDRRPSDGETMQARTDVVIVASIDPMTQTIGVLDIPRDTYMAPPGAPNPVMVNTLFRNGEDAQEGTGPYEVMETVQYNLGLYIDRYVLFDFDGFITLIDAIGGIEITTEYPINDATFPDMNFGYDPLYLPAGTHVLDGYDALRYARTRHSDSDLVRGQRQLQVIQAVQERITQTGVFRDLLRNAPDLLDSLESDFYTDMSLEEMIQLGRYVILIPPESVSTGSISNEYRQRITVSGRRVRIPDSAALPELMVQVFGDNYNSP
jgi:LCP family protein required for cell wall assembly